MQKPEQGQEQEVDHSWSGTKARCVIGGGMVVKLPFKNHPDLSAHPKMDAQLALKEEDDDLVEVDVDDQILLLHPDFATVRESPSLDVGPEKRGKRYRRNNRKLWGWTPVCDSFVRPKASSAEAEEGMALPGLMEQEVLVHEGYKMKEKGRGEDDEDSGYEGSSDDEASHAQRTPSRHHEGTGERHYAHLSSKGSPDLHHSGLYSGLENNETHDATEANETPSYPRNDNRDNKRTSQPQNSAKTPNANRWTSLKDLNLASFTQGNESEDDDDDPYHEKGARQELTSDGAKKKKEAHPAVEITRRILDRLDVPDRGSVLSMEAVLKFKAERERLKLQQQQQQQGSSKRPRLRLPSPSPSTEPPRKKRSKRTQRLSTDSLDPLPHAHSGLFVPESDVPILDALHVKTKKDKGIASFDPGLRKGTRGVARRGKSAAMKKVERTVRPKLSKKEEEERRRRSLVID